MKFTNKELDLIAHALRNWADEYHCGPEDDNWSKSIEALADKALAMREL